MKPEESILVEVLQQDETTREEFINHACKGDPALRGRVMSLLRGYEGAGAMLENSPVAGSAGVARSRDATSAHDYAVGARIGRYKILQELGEGGYGAAFMAEQEEPVRRRVALKVIKLGMDTREVIKRFEAERQALALMDHPNIAHVLDAGATESGRPFFVMELVQGVAITHHCDQCRLGTVERVKLFIQVCSAIQHAHQKGIIHRDLKPSNVLVTLHDGVPVPKIIDFGIAKAMHEPLLDRTHVTAFEQFIGTPAYMSPEQLDAGRIDIDTRSDIYSLGVLLYELLTGRTPFGSRDLLKTGVDEMRRTIREKVPARPSARVGSLSLVDGISVAEARGTDPSKLRSWLRGDIDWIVMRCLEKDRSRRYETANGLAQDLIRHLRHEPTTARPPSTAYHLGKLIRRNRLAFGAATAVLLALVAGMGISAWFLVRERAAHQRAALEAERSAQVARLMQDMLTGVGPQVAVGRDTRLLRTILDETVIRIESQLAGQPEVEASFRETLGRVYQDLGELSAAALMYERSLQLRREVFGSDHVLVADSLQHLGEVRVLQDRLQEAETLLTEALAMRGKWLGADHAATTDSRTALAHVRMVARAAEAESTTNVTPAGESAALEAKPSVIRLNMAGGTVGGKPIMPNFFSIAFQQRALEREFEADGIRIEWSSPSYDTANEKVVQSPSDFSHVGPVNDLEIRAAGRDYRLLMPIRPPIASLALAVHSDSPFRTVADLRGKRIVICKVTNSHLALCRIMEKSGFHESDFDLVPVKGFAAVESTFAGGEADARMIFMGAAVPFDQLRGSRVIAELGDDYNVADVGKLAVSADFERRYPEIVQRVVTTLVKSAAWISDERNRETVLELWANSPQQREALAAAYAGPRLKESVTPLMDERFMAGLRRDCEDAKRFGLIRPDADMSFDGWVEPKYLERALNELNLNGLWPEYDAEGRLKKSAERASD